MNGKGEIGCSVLGNALHNHVDNDVRVRNGRENLRGNAGFITHVVNGKLCLFAIHADAAHHDVFHVRRLLLRQRANGIMKTGAHFKWHGELFRKLDRA